VQIVDFDRVEECCGFGGKFSVTEEAVAAEMGYDKLAFMQKVAPDCIVSSDMSCLMHLQGCARRQKQEIPFPHFVEILNGQGDRQWCYGTLGEGRTRAQSDRLRPPCRARYTHVD